LIGHLSSFDDVEAQLFAIDDKGMTPRQIAESKEARAVVAYLKQLEKSRRSTIRHFFIYYNFIT
jgi:hypothetical protein